MCSGDQKAKLLSCSLGLGYLCMVQAGTPPGGGFSLSCLVLGCPLRLPALLLCSPTPSSVAAVCSTVSHVGWSNRVLCRARQGCPSVSMMGEAQSRQVRRRRACQSNRITVSCHLGTVCFKLEPQKNKSKAFYGCRVWHIHCCQGSPDTL